MEAYVRMRNNSNTVSCLDPPTSLFVGGVVLMLIVGYTASCIVVNLRLMILVASVAAMFFLPFSFLFLLQLPLYVIGKFN